MTKIVVYKYTNQYRLIYLHDLKKIITLIYFLFILFNLYQFYHFIKPQFQYCGQNDISVKKNAKCLLMVSSCQTLFSSTTHMEEQAAFEW